MHAYTSLHQQDLGLVEITGQLDKKTAEANHRDPFEIDAVWPCSLVTAAGHCIPQKSLRVMTPLISTADKRADATSAVHRDTCAKASEHRPTCTAVTPESDRTCVCVCVRWTNLLAEEDFTATFWVGRAVTEFLISMAAMFAD